MIGVNGELMWQVDAGFHLAGQRYLCLGIRCVDTGDEGVYLDTGVGSALPYALGYAIVLQYGRCVLQSDFHTSDFVSGFGGAPNATCSRL